MCNFKGSTGPINHFWQWKKNLRKLAEMIDPALMDLSDEWGVADDELMWIEESRWVPNSGESEQVGGGLQTYQEWTHRWVVVGSEWRAIKNTNATLINSI